MPRMHILVMIIAGILSGAAVAQNVGTATDSTAEIEPSGGLQIIASRTGAENPPETLTVRSKLLGEDRQIYVQLPTGYYMSNRRYPLVFVMDGEWLFDLASAHIRYYSYDEVTDETIPRMIVVGIANTDRDQNYTPTPNSGTEQVFPTAGDADTFLQFIEQELIPLIDGRYRTQPSRTIVGWSFSGLFAAYSAVAKPDLFGAHLCISPAVWWDNELVLEQMQNLQLDRAKRMVFTLGSNEVGGWVSDSTKRLVKYMENKPVPGMSFDYFEFENVGHTWGVASAMDKGLQALFAGYIAPREISEDGMSAIDAYYQDLSDQWGYSVTPPNKVLHAAANKAWLDGNRQTTIEILRLAMANEPNNSLTRYMLGMTYEAMGNVKQALNSYSGAILAEQKKPVPNEGSLRNYRARVDELENLH